VVGHKLWRWAVFANKTWQIPFVHTNFDELLRKWDPTNGLDRGKHEMGWPGVVKFCTDFSNVNSHTKILFHQYLEQLYYSIVMGLGQKILTWVGSNFVAQVGSGQPSLVWVWIWNQNFSIFCPSGQKNVIGSKSTRVKAGSVSYLLRIKSMFGSGQGHLYYSS